VVTDAFEVILCGVAAVQVATQHRPEGASCFDWIAGELQDIMSRKRHSSLEDFQGNLKENSKKLTGKSYDKAQEKVVQGPGPGRSALSTH